MSINIHPRNVFCLPYYTLRQGKLNLTNKVVYLGIRTSDRVQYPLLEGSWRHRAILLWSVRHRWFCQGKVCKILSLLIECKVQPWEVSWMKYLEQKFTCLDLVSAHLHPIMLTSKSSGKGKSWMIMSWRKLSSFIVSTWSWMRIEHEQCMIPVITQCNKINHK